MADVAISPYSQCGYTLACQTYCPARSPHLASPCTCPVHEYEGSLLMTGWNSVVWFSPSRFVCFPFFQRTHRKDSQQNIRRYLLNFSFSEYQQSFSSMTRLTCNLLPCPTRLESDSSCHFILWHCFLYLVICFNTIYSETEIQYCALGQ